MDNKPRSVCQWFSAHITKVHAVRIRGLHARRDLENKFSLQSENDALDENAAIPNSLSGPAVISHAAAQSNTNITAGQSDTVATKLSDGAQMLLPIVLAIGDGVPVVGGVVKAVAGGLLYLLQRMESCNQNKEDLQGLVTKLERAMQDAETFPVIRTKAQEETQKEFVRLLFKIEKIRSGCCRFPLQWGSSRLMQEITACAKEMDCHMTNYLVARFVMVYGNELTSTRSRRGVRQKASFILTAS
ncbi:hypothetical protein SCLCIDRAFT_1105053 [Scleroderma citrinum Foug A]|uniref:Uncharacterized protein n=1 Tax=Scleroderma citrinum Foug A TaxID=1036808 RepID=A0A0C3E3T2_9AGAM|nr:hypothetical protein SCLCIDRAFT_1105053 [Scleroderma citrinum Foug A]